MTDEIGDKKIVDSAIIREDSNGIMRKNAFAAGYRAITDADEIVVLGNLSNVLNSGNTAVGVKVDVHGANATAIGNYTKEGKICSLRCFILKQAGH